MRTIEELLQDGLAEEGRGHYEQAARIYRQILRIKPNHAAAIGQLGIARAGQGRIEEALEQFDKVARLDPDSADTHNNRGQCLLRMNRLEEAAEAFGRAWKLDPELPNVLGNYAYLRRVICDWQSIDELTQLIVDSVRRRKPAISPLLFLHFSDEPADILACARQKAPVVAAPRPPVRSRGSGDKIRLGYLSADFRNHAVGHLIADLIERHDRERFEVTAISVGKDDGSAHRKRLQAAFDSFLDLPRASHEELADAIARRGIDILVDLMGRTEGDRLMTFARRPAPVQVNYFGYPGTSGADFIDYIIADPFVAPPGADAFYSEKLVRLPDCYQPNDTRREFSASPPSRAGAGLPDAGFVFASFNNSLKITPSMFDVWMRLLRQVPGSVLWQLVGHDTVLNNLRREATARGIDGARIVPAPLKPLPEHLARHRLADLFLDTLPWGAHVTASQALWTGLPVVACVGQSFHSRVTGSLLHAIGLPDLVATDLAQYEKIALSLATDPGKLREVRERLARNRTTAPLFDIDRYRRHIENAYETMMEIARRGEPPRAFSVHPID